MRRRIPASSPSATRVWEGSPTSRASCSPSTGESLEVRPLHKGGAAAIRGVVANESNVIINGALATQPFVMQNQLKGIAVSGIEAAGRAQGFADLQGAEPAGGGQRDLAGHVTTAGTPAPMVAR